MHDVQFNLVILGDVGHGGLVNPVPGVTKIMRRVSQKNTHISFENQYFKKIQPPMEPRHLRGSIDRAICAVPLVVEFF